MPPSIVSPMAAHARNSAIWQGATELPVSDDGGIRKSIGRRRCIPIGAAKDESSAPILGSNGHSGASQHFIVRAEAGG